MTVRDVYDYINGIAPFESALSYDNVGLLLGDFNTQVNKTGVCLDITANVLENAVEQKINLIVCHHPVIFNPVGRIERSSVLYGLIKNDIAVIAAHTNLDIAPSGVAEQLCDTLGLRITGSLYDDGSAIGRLACAESQSADSFAALVRSALGSPDIRLCGKSVCSVAVVPGSGGEYISAAVAAGADTLLTGEVKHHEWIQAGQLGITVIDAGHYFTEQVVLQPLCESIRDRLGDAVVLLQPPPYRKV